VDNYVKNLSCQRYHPGALSITVACIKIAAAGNTQEITLRGEPAVIVLSTQSYQKLLQSKPNLVDFLSNSPLKGIDLNIDRDNAKMRDIEL
jgi:antitoxin Phd